MDAPRQLTYEIRIALGRAPKRFCRVPTPVEAAAQAQIRDAWYAPVLWRTAAEIRRLYEGPTVDELLADNHRGNLPCL